MTVLGLVKAALATLTVPLGTLLMLSGLSIPHYRKGLRQQNQSIIRGKTKWT
jgi:hypothetical protein